MTHFERLELKAQAGDSFSQLQLACHYFEKSKTDLTAMELAKFYFTLAAHNGEAEAQFQLAQILAQHSEQKNLFKARWWFEKAAAQNHPLARQSVREKMPQLCALGA